MSYISFGPLPISNRFQNSVENDETLYDLTLVQDDNTGMVRIKTHIPYDEMIPRFDWLTETEPSEHFKHVSNIIENQFFDYEKVKVLGLSYRDEPLICSLKKEKFSDSRVINYSSIEEIIYPGVSQQVKILSSDNIKGKFINEGKADLVLGNRILHHVEDILGFLENIKNFISDDGLLVLEVPDCTSGFQNLDYNIVFEEHINYFTEYTFIKMIELAGLDIVYYHRYPFPVEDALIAIAKIRTGGKNKKLDNNQILMGSNLFKMFGESFPVIKNRINRFVDKYNSDGKTVVFGAGHHGCMFVNLMGLKDKIDCFIDDNSSKQKYFSPGSGLPIRASNYLTESNIGLCIVSVSQINEELIVNNIKKLSNKDFPVYSIFPKSSYALPIFSNKYIN